MAENITPLDIDIASSPDPLTYPLNKRFPVIPDFDRAQYYSDCGYSRKRKPSQFIADQADKYFANFQIIDADGTPQIRDSLGDIYNVPDEVAHVSSVIMRTAPTGIKVVTGSRASWLTFADARNIVRLVIPDYGWNSSRQIVPFVARFGWDFVLAEPDYNFPGFETALIAPVGEGLQDPGQPTPRKSHWWNKG